MTEHDEKTISAIVERWQAGSVLVVGQPGAGKLTALREAAALILNGDAPALEFAASPYTTLEDMVGRRRTSHHPDGTSELRFVPGIWIEAMREGRRLIVANADELTGPARSAMLAILRGQPLPALRGGEHVTALIHPGFALAATAVKEDFELADAFASTIKLN